MFFIAFNGLFPWSLIDFNCFLFLPSIFFNIFKGFPSFSSSFKPLFKNLLNGEYSNLSRSTVLGLGLRSYWVKYSYLSKLLENNANILAAFLSKSYCASLCIFFLPKTLFWSTTVFLLEGRKFFLNLRGSLASNVVSIVKEKYGFLVHSL